MNDILKALDGKKTYFVAVLWGLATAAFVLGWIDQNTYQIIQGILFPAGLASLRASVGGSK